MSEQAEDPPERVAAAQPPGVRRRLANQPGRASRTAAGMWFWEIDRVLMLMALLLIAIGLVAVAAASPVSAQRYSGGTHHVPAMFYFWRQLAWVAASVPVMILVSMLPLTMARRFALIGAGVFLVLLIAVPVIGVEVNGSRRWIGIGAFQLQPSEFLKPLFIVATAWMLSFRAKDPELPVLIITGAADRSRRRAADDAARFRADHRVRGGLAAAADALGHLTGRDRGADGHRARRRARGLFPLRHRAHPYR